MDDRYLAWPMSDSHELFAQVDGYYPADSLSLQRTLEEMHLLDEAARSQPQTIATYIKWSYTTSFMMMLNAWQWFLSGILVGRQACLPAQVQHLNYYSTFFSYCSFLAAQFRGCYTTARSFRGSGEWKRERRLVWIAGRHAEPWVELGSAGSDQHAKTADWFYDVFANWDGRAYHPIVEGFAEEPYKGFLVGERHFFTYHLENMVDELSRMPEPVSPTAEQALLDLWACTGEATEIHPEEAWALAHLRLVTQFHQDLVRATGGGPSYRGYQAELIRALCEHHAKTGLRGLLERATAPFLD